MRLVLSVFIIIAASLSSGCIQARGIPSHGGGKRFSEEQRIVAGVVRQALAQMDLSDLRGRRVMLEVQSIAHEGSGNMDWTGLQDLNGGAYFNGTDNWYNTGTSVNRGNGGNFSARLRTAPDYTSNSGGTSADLSYLRASLEMKARHEGVILTNEKPDAFLYVLVDVLGTNRSRQDDIFIVRDFLEGVCEITYYAQSPASGELVFRARRVAASSNYNEKHLMGHSKIEVKRSLQSITPTTMPIDSASSPLEPTTSPFARIWPFLD